MSTRADLRDLDLEALRTIVTDLGQPGYRADQVFAWIHREGATSLTQMTNVPKSLRLALAEQLELTTLEVDQVAESADGTKKMRLLCADGMAIESVLIPGEGKLTQCLSTQVGCALGCAFCATATMGIKRNLSAAEIVDQVYRGAAQLDRSKGERISNLVYMGMGEPMANLDQVLQSISLLCQDKGADFSPRRVTVSTAGLVPGIEEMGKRAPNVGLAISLHATTDKLRSELMPVNRRWPLAKLMATLRAYPLPRRRRITFEYVLLDGINDDLADARRLVKLISGIPAKVNLLPYNPTRPDQPQLMRPSDERVEAFAETLRAKDVNATVRRSRGLDIAAACGQLALAGVSASGSGQRVALRREGNDLGPVDSKRKQRGRSDR
jgi:23S rRNA (adenine2503-C2)-methyltransferase